MPEILMNVICTHRFMFHEIIRITAISKDLRIDIVHLGI